MRLTGVFAMEGMFSRGLDDLIARDSEPMHFRLVLQPIVATALAIRAGWSDARARQPPFFWALISETKQRRSLFRQMWKDIGRLFLLAVALDVVYQIIVLHAFYPMQTIIVATALAIVPYLMVRGVANRVAS
jgi:hypothetical protein